MGDSVLYADYIPALMSFIITLIWFCAAIAIPDEPPPMLIWGAMACVVLGGASIFMLPPSVAWMVVAGQIVFSFFLVRWFKNSTFIFASSKSNNHMQANEHDLMQKRAMGK
jgi:hypothetical protein